MTTKFKRITAGLVAVAAASTAALAASPASVSALPAGTPPDNTLNAIPATGNSDTDFTLNMVDVQGDIYCSGDGIAGYNWAGFIVPATEDPATITWTPTAFPQDVPGVLPLINANGGPLPAKAPGLGSGVLNVGAVTLDLDNGAYAGLSGEYKIGYGCFNNTDPQPYPTTDYFETTFTITPGTGGGTHNFTWAQGVAPTAPVATATGVDGEITVNWTEDANDDSYDVTVSGGDLGSPVVVNNASDGEVVAGFTNGVTYDVTVTANKAGFSSATSAPVSVFVSSTPQPPVTNLTATPVPGGDIDVSWTAPAGETAVRDGYTVSVAPADIGPVTLAAGATSTTLSGLTVGTSYVVTVVATYPSPDAGTPATVAATSQPNAVLEQTITVDRPAGALLFTQRCGVNDQLEPVAPGVVFGFWDGLGEITSSADQVGTAPIDLNTTAADTNFGEYPYPIDETTGEPNPNYTTQCALDLGRAELVTQQDDPFRGTFFRANGLLDQITVVDTRDGDAGWTLSGDIDTFTGPADTFTGDYLGWSPEVNFVSAADPLSGYQINPTAGAAVAPATSLGLSASPTLASAPASAGLGIAELDARLLLLIPLSADAGNYNGTLTFTLS